MKTGIAPSLMQQCCKLPAAVINKLTHQISIDIDFNKAPETVKQKIFNAAINLWYLIYDKQVNDDTCINLSYFTHISKFELEQNRFTIKYDKKEYCYSKFIAILKSASLVEVNGNYRFARKGYSIDGKAHTKSYRVNKEFIKGNSMIEIEIDFRSLIKNTRSKSYWLKLYPQYAELIKDCYRAKVDLVNYINWLNENIGIDLGKRGVGKSYLEYGKLIEYTVMEDRFLDAERIMRYSNSAIKHNLGNLWFKVSDEGRFYTSVINLSSTVIESPDKSIKHAGYLLLNKRRVRSIDIKNSHPLLLASLIDCPEYERDCGAGLFYQKIMDKTGKTKEEVKNLLYRYIFFNNNSLGTTGETHKILEELYPGLVEQINAIKAKQSLAHLLQRMEADIIVEGCGGLDFPKLLRHDQVLMFEENYQDVADYLKDRYKELGLKVSFK